MLHDVVRTLCDVARCNCHPAVCNKPVTTLCSATSAFDSLQLILDALVSFKHTPRYQSEGTKSQVQTALKAEGSLSLTVNTKKTQLFITIHESVVWKVRDGLIPILECNQCSHIGINTNLVSGFLVIGLNMF